VDRSRDWFDQAVGDLEHAKADLERGFYDWACFSSQQAAEKALKAVFQRMGAEAWGHSVADLLEELAKVHQVPVDLITRPLSSTRFTSQPDIPTPTRAAPQGVGRYREGEARRLVAYGEEILKFCEGLLSSDLKRGGP